MIFGTIALVFSVLLLYVNSEYEWQKIGTFSPTGVGGDERGNWEMNVDSTFGIQLYGTAAATIIPAGKLTIDNFVLSSTL